MKVNKYNKELRQNHKKKTTIRIKPKKECVPVYRAYSDSEQGQQTIKEEREYASVYTWMALNDLHKNRAK